MGWLYVRRRCGGWLWAGWAWGDRSCLCPGQQVRQMTGVSGLLWSPHILAPASHHHYHHPHLALLCPALPYNHFYYPLQPACGSSKLVESVWLHPQTHAHTSFGHSGAKSSPESDSSRSADTVASWRRRPGLRTVGPILCTPEDPSTHTRENSEASGCLALI